MGSGPTGYTTAFMQLELDESFYTQGAQPGGTAS
jgi:hypothetical protein